MVLSRWRYDREFVYLGESSCLIAKVFDEADAPLITSAPELLAALRALLSYTKACEALLNSMPSGQVVAAECLIDSLDGLSDKTSRMFALWESAPYMYSALRQIASHEPTNPNDDVYWYAGWVAQRAREVIERVDGK